MKPGAFCFLISVLFTLLSQAQPSRGPGRPAPLTPNNSTGSSGKYVALLVGVGTYEDASILPLNYPSEDVRTLAGILADYNFKRPDIVTLIDPKEHEFSDTLNKLTATLAPTDNLLIFFSGHGELVRERSYYWLAADARKDSRDGWISVSAVLKLLGEIDCKHILLIIDSCHGGAIFTQPPTTTRNGIGADALRASPELIRQYGDKKSGEAITSGTPQEVVPDKSHFFAALKTGLMLNPYRYVLSSGLFNYVREHTIAAQSKPSFRGTRVTPQRSTIHYLDDQGGEFVFYKPTGISVTDSESGKAPAPVNKTIEVGKGIQEIRIRVQPGQVIRIEASGSIVAGQFVGVVTPAGKTHLLGFPISHYNIDPTLPHGALLYRLGPEQPWRFCGESCSFQLPTPGDATVQLTVNDNNQVDNSGSFTVRVR